MRLPVSALVVLLAAAAGCSTDDKKDAPADKTATGTPKAKLDVGDPAPPLVAPVWVQGPPTTFEAGHVYVLEFWATWCGPCLQAMPHLAGLMEEHKGQGLHVLALTTRDDNGNTREKVAEFVRRRGGRYGFPFAFFETDATNQAYMDAAGQDAIPASFVIDRAGKVAFIGSPHELDDVLPRVLAGTWQGQASLDEIKHERDALDAVVGRIKTAADKAGQDYRGKGEQAVTAAVADAAAAAAETAWQELPAYEAKYPLRAGQSAYAVLKVVVALQARRFDDAAALADKLTATAVARKDTTTLGRLRDVWLTKALNPDKKRPATAVRAVEEVLKVEGEADVATLISIARTYAAVGDAEKAKQYGEKALKAAGDDKRLRESIEKALKRSMN